MCISNPDVEFDDNLVCCVKEDFDCYPNLGIVSGVQMTPEGKVSPNAFWVKKTFKSEMLFMIRSLTLVRRIAPSRKRQEYIRDTITGKKELFEVPVLSGCLFFARLSVMQTIGDFDEETFLYYEEDILAEKMRCHGHLIGIDPRAHFLHIGGGSTRNVLDNAAVFTLSCKSYLYFAKRYLLKSVFQRIAFYFVFGVFWVDRKALYIIRKLLGMD